MGLGDMLGGDDAKKQDGADKQHGDKLGGLVDEANEFVADQQEQNSGKPGEDGNKADDFVDGQQERLRSEGQ
jgi:hypothetical protein